MHTVDRSQNFKHPPRAQSQRIHSPFNISYSLCRCKPNEIHSNPRDDFVNDILESETMWLRTVPRLRASNAKSCKRNPRKESTDDAHNRLIFWLRSMAKYRFTTHLLTTIVVIVEAIFRFSRRMSRFSVTFRQYFHFTSHCHATHMILNKK